MQQNNSQTKKRRDTALDFSQGDVQQALEHIRRSILPEMSQKSGFEGLSAAMDSTTQSTLLISETWTTKSELDAAHKTNEVRLRYQQLHGMANGQPRVQDYDILILQ